MKCLQTPPAGMLSFAQDFVQLLIVNEEVCRFPAVRAWTHLRITSSISVELNDLHAFNDQKHLCDVCLTTESFQAILPIMLPGAQKKDAIGMRQCCSLLDCLDLVFFRYHGRYITLF